MRRVELVKLEPKDDSVVMLSRGSKIVDVHYDGQDVILVVDCPDIAKELEKRVIKTVVSSIQHGNTQLDGYKIARGKPSFIGSVFIKPTSCIDPYIVSVFEVIDCES